MSSLASFHIRAGDRRPSIRAALTDATGAPINVTSETVTFTMLNADTLASMVNAASAVKVDALAGLVEYQWQDGDTELAGLYLAHWTLTDTNGRAMRVPNTGSLIISIYSEA